MSRWSFNEETMPVLQKNTSSSGEELESLLKDLISAAEPLEGKFDGEGKAAFAAFKNNSETITADLKQGLGRINQGQQEMDTAFRTGDETMADDANSDMGKANFDAAKFK